MRNKKCYKCGLEKPVADFNVSKCAKSGYQGHCRSCQRMLARGYRLKYQAEWEKRNADKTVDDQ